VSIRDHDNQAIRSQIFAKLKKALADGPVAAARRVNVEQRLAQPPAHPLPQRVRRTPDALRAQFRSYLEGQSATVHEVASRADVPATVAAYLRANNLPQTVRCGDDAYLAALPWDREPTMQRLYGPAVATDPVGLSHALAGIAETGTVAMASGHENPVTINFVPETHIIVLEDADLVGPYEEVWTRIRSRFGTGHLPRTVNFISGPSRTADIGGKLVTGAHGPRHLCVILVRA
jgi:L-lactate dehydrogenase complex protein LldG